MCWQQQTSAARRYCQMWQRVCGLVSCDVSEAFSVFVFKCCFFGPLNSCIWRRFAPSKRRGNTNRGTKGHIAEDAVLVTTLWETQIWHSSMAATLLTGESQPLWRMPAVGSCCHRYCSTVCLYIRKGGLPYCSEQRAFLQLHWFGCVATCSLALLLRYLLVHITVVCLNNLL